MNLSTSATPPPKAKAVNTASHIRIIPDNKSPMNRSRKALVIAKPGTKSSERRSKYYQ